MPCFTTSCQQLVDDGRCELLRVPSGVRECRCKIQNRSSVILDVLSRKGLRLEVFDRSLDPLNIPERVLLHNFNDAEPVDREELAFLFFRSQAVDRLAKLLSE
jgi:hypothetical protein